MMVLVGEGYCVYKIGRVTYLSLVLVSASCSVFKVMLFLLLVLFLTWIGFLIYRDVKKPNNFPPGPSWLPILGSGLTLSRLKKKAGDRGFLAVAKLAEHYGPVVGLRVGNDLQVACCSYESFKEMVNNEDFSGRPITPFFTARTWGTKRGLLFTEGEVWKTQRTIALKSLKRSGFGRKTMFHVLEAHSNHLVNDFKQKIGDFENTGKVIDMTNPFGANFISTLWAMMAGKQYSPEDEELKKLEGLIDQFFKHADVTGTLFSWFPFLIKVAPKLSGYNAYVEVHQNLAEFIKMELDRHRETFQEGDTRDLMDAYLEEIDSKDRNSDLSELDVLAAFMDLFMAGAGTSYKALGFTFLYLLVYPEVQVKAREEIDEIVGQGRLPTFDDKPNLPYIEAIVNETLRLFVANMFSLPYRAIKTTTLQGYTIPKDTMLVVNFYCIHKNKEFWGDPEVFRPERFLNSEGKIVLPEYLMPFGFGSRKCIGPSLARSYMFLMTAVLLQNFEFMVPPGQAPPSTKGIDGFTPSPGVYSALVKYRK